MTCLLLSSNRRLCSQPRNYDLRFSLGRGKEICVFSWGQFIGSRYYCYFYYCFWRYFFFHLMYDMGQQLGARAFRRANLCLFSVEVFSFLFRSWQILLVSASAIFSIGLTIFTSFPSWKNYQGRKRATANRRPFWKVIWSNFRIWFSSFYLWCSKTPSS